MAKNKRLRGKVDKPVSPAVVQQRSREKQYAEGKAIRDTCPRESHADWKPPADRSDPTVILEASDKEFLGGPKAARAATSTSGNSMT
jgi:hypothetical protein